MSDDSVWDRLGSLPDLDSEPLEADWLSPQHHPETEPRAPASPAQPSPGPPAHTEGLRQDPRRVRVGTPASPYPVPEPGAAVHTEPAPHTPGTDIDDVPHAPPRRRRKSRAGRFVASFVALVLIAAVAGVAVAWIMWARVDKIETAGSLSPDGDLGTNYLIVGTDSRAGVDAGLDSAPNIGLGVEGERSDTMLILHLHKGSEGSDTMVSLPRDLWVAYDSGSAGKLNGARAIGGVPELIRTVTTDPGIPVQHYLEVDIAGFLQVIEAVGSITIEFPRPACDPRSGLDVRTTGAVALDPEQALAYVRSRRYTEFDAAGAAGLTCDQIKAQGLGTEVGIADFGRTDRQRRFLLAVFDEVSGTRNPVTVMRTLNGLSGGLRVDDTMSMFDAFSLLRELRGIDATTVALPVTDLQIAGQAALALTPESSDVLAGLATDSSTASGQ